MTFIVILLVVSGWLAYVVASSEQRQTYLDTAIDVVRRLKVAATEPGQEHDLFYDALRARMSYVFVTAAIAVISATVLIGMWFGTGAIGNPATLVAWGASLGTRTTNGEWWRLMTSTFVHTGTLHLLVDLAVLIQLGVILERLVGRLTVAAVYVSAGVFAGLVNLSSHPLAVTVGASGAIFGLYGLLLALLIWQTFHEWRGTWQTQADADTTESEAKAGAEPHVLDTLQLQLDRPQLDTWSPAGVRPADHLRQNYGPPERHVKAEAGPPALDASWGIVDETPEPVVETWSPPVVGPSVETWDPAVVGPSVETWDPAVEASSPAIVPWDPAAKTGGPALAGPATTVPLVAMKRIGAGAAVFLVYSMLGGFAGAAEFTGLLVGLMYGLVLARRAGEQEPTRRQIGFVTAVAGVVVVACAVTLRNIADVKPEIARVLAIEERTTAAYRSGSEAFRKGRLSADALVLLAERTIVPELQAADARLKALSNVPPEHQPLVADAREYLRLRCASWRAHAEALRKTGGVPERAAGGATDGSWRLQAEARFRSNLAAMGTVEGAERASLEAFQRVRLP
jgi:membrane associated rhomboid family serine protease